MNLRPGGGGNRSAIELKELSCRTKEEILLNVNLVHYRLQTQPQQTLGTTCRAYTCMTDANLAYAGNNVLIVENK